MPQLELRSLIHSAFSAIARRRLASRLKRSWIAALSLAGDGVEFGIAAKQSLGLAFQHPAMIGAIQRQRIADRSAGIRRTFGVGRAGEANLDRNDSQHHSAHYDPHAPKAFALLRAYLRVAREHVNAFGCRDRPAVAASRPWSPSFSWRAKPVRAVRLHSARPGSPSPHPANSPARGHRCSAWRRPDR